MSRSRSRQCVIERRVLEDWGARCRERRKMFRLTQSELAELSGVAQPTISEVERARGPVTDDTKCRIATALRSPVGELFPWPKSLMRIKDVP